MFWFVAFGVFMIVLALFDYIGEKFIFSWEPVKKYIDALPLMRNGDYDEKFKRDSSNKALH